MHELTVETYEAVLQTIRQWPLERRLSLVQDVIRTMKSDMEQPRSKKDTLSSALGLLATDRPAPSDEEVQRWLDEHRLEKYG